MTIMTHIHDEIVKRINQIRIKLSQSYKQFSTKSDDTSQLKLITVDHCPKVDDPKLTVVDINKNLEQNKVVYNQTIHNQVDIKERIGKLIKENENYFIDQIIRTTVDTILYDNIRDVEKLKTFGYSHRIAAEIFEKHRIFIYACDLYTYIYAPKNVRYQLEKLIEEYGLERVTEEIALYLKENYSERFEIKIICTP